MKRSAPTMAAASSILRTRTLISEGYIMFQRAGEQEWLLENHADPPP